MPKCKNDETRNYKGTEPSPKGLGYCAHAEPVGKICEGRNGEQWKVQKTKNGTKRWVKSSNESVNQADNVKEENVWGKNKRLENFWQHLANGTKIVAIYKDGTYKIIKLPNIPEKNTEKLIKLTKDPNVKVLLSSFMSQDAYEIYLYPKAKNKTVKEVINNYKTYFKHINPSGSVIFKDNPEKNFVFKKMYVPY